MIADEVARSPYILGLVWWVTKKDYLATRRNTGGALGRNLPVTSRLKAWCGASRVSGPHRSLRNERNFLTSATG